jgi:DNA (cytosine-5)-methyltransferase 1
VLTIGSLFSGIGGLELGLEWAGLGPVLWQCEIDPFCRAVLAKHWPDVRRYEDVTARTDWPRVDLICGGFPCQDVSSAGKGRGLGGVRSGLWYHFAHVVSEVRPHFVVVENVASGARRWLRPVRHQLHLLGYRTRALGIGAADVGAPHLRRRIFVIASHAIGEHVHQQSWRRCGANGEAAPVAAWDGSHGSMADHDEAGRDERAGCRPSSKGQGRHAPARRGEDVADASGERSSQWRIEPARQELEASERSCIPGNAWAAEPDVGRVAYGVPSRVDRLKALGNAVVPQCAQVVGEVIQQMIAIGMEARS